LFLVSGDRRREAQTPPMNKRGRAKFNGRDYSASVIIEILALNGQLDNKLYCNLEAARKARNGWALDMAPPTTIEVHAALSALEQLLSVNLRLQHGAETGALPKWPVSMLSP